LAEFLSVPQQEGRAAPSPSRLGTKGRFEITWNGIRHLEVRSLAPGRQPGPIIDTSYLSHFIARQIVEEIGGPAGCRANIDAASPPRYFFL